MMNDLFLENLVDKTVMPYKAAGKFAYFFARGKVLLDPMFVAFLKLGLIPNSTQMLDLGCGQGLLISWLLTARQLFQAGLWPKEWPAPPLLDSIQGIDLMPRDVERAKKAIGTQAQFSVGDVRTAELGKADVVMLLDVLHYLSYSEQEAVLQKIRNCLTDNGVFITRVGDYSAGLPCLYSQWVDLIASFMRGHRLPRLYCRSIADWQTLLLQMGFSVETYPMSQGTLFDNSLLVAKLN